ncbi:MAG TPA: hypothetical protein VE359_01135, partial [Vicinamibacteria bacterium]|nr:hypothetical protein [Vicinamibacteria bacterium]
PANRSASDDLVIVRNRIETREQEKRDRAGLDQLKARAQSTARVPGAVLSPRSPVPITMRFEDGSLQKIFESLGRIAGVNVLFDEGFRDKKASVNLTGVSFEEALDRLTFVNRLFYKVVDQNTLIIVPESRQKRVAYDELLLRTFYVQNAEINDTVNLVKTLAKVTTVGPNPSLGAITVLGTVDQIAMAERIIEGNDKARGEVVVEVQILELNRTKIREWGIDISNYSAAATLSPTGATNEVAGGLLNIRAYLLSSLNQADWVVTLPSTILAKFTESNNLARVLASPRLRAAEGKKAELKIGEEVPIPVTTFGAGSAAGSLGSYIPATSFQYKNVGVNLSLTPRVAASGDITLEFAAEFSIIGGNQNVGSVKDPLFVPTFLTRNVTGVLRLRDGEAALIGGLVQSNETVDAAGVLGIGSLPILGKLFGTHKRQFKDSEVVISMTPRVVRAPKLVESDFRSLSVGTQEVPRVQGARPGLFGKEPEAPGPAPVTRPAPAPAVVPAPTAPASAAPPGPVPPTEPPPAAAPAASPVPPEAIAADARPATALFSPPEVALRVGESGGLALVLVGARDVQSIEVTLAWDPALAEVTDVAAGSLLTLDGSPVSAERALEVGRARVRFSRAVGATGSGAVVAVTMKGLKAGSGSVVVESLAVGRGGSTERPAPPAPGRLVVAP